MVKKIKAEIGRGEKGGFGIAITVTDVPLTRRGEDLAKERNLTVIEDKVGNKKDKESK